MKWTTEVSGKRFVLTQIQTVPAVLQGYYILLAAIFGWAWGGDTIIGWLVRAVTFYVLLWLTFLFLSLRRYRRMVRLSGSRTMHYEMTDNQISVQIGTDKISLPRNQLHVRKIGSNFIILKRQGTRFGTLVLQFDDPDTQEKVRTALV